jgi:hypothetical protein
MREIDWPGALADFGRLIGYSAAGAAAADRMIAAGVDPSPKPPTLTAIRSIRQRPPLGFGAVQANAPESNKARTIP